MSKEMAEKKKQELEELGKTMEKLTEDLKHINEDRCPHCLQPISAMPYVNFHPVMGWVECAACGIVFSPKSIRDVKLKKAKDHVHIKEPSLIVPATTLR